MTLYYTIKLFFIRWRYKRKYGIDIDTAIEEYGKYCVLTAEVNNEF